MKNYISLLKEDEQKNLKDILKPYKDSGKIIYNNETHEYMFLMKIVVSVKINREYWYMDDGNLEEYPPDNTDFYVNEIFNNMLPSKDEIENEIVADGDAELEQYLEYIPISENEANLLYNEENDDIEIDDDIRDEIFDRDDEHMVIYKQTYILDKLGRKEEELNKIYNDIIELLEEYKNNIDYNVNEAKTTNSIYIEVTLIDNNDNEIDEKTIRISDHAPNLGASKDFNIMVNSEFYNRRGFEDLMTSEDSIDDIRIWIEDTLEDLPIKEFMKFSEWKKTLTEAIDKFVNVLPTNDEEKAEILAYFNKFKDVKVNWHEKNKEKLLNDLREIMAKNLSKTQLKKKVKELGVAGIPTDEYIEGKDYEGYKVYIPLTFRASRMLGSVDVGSELGKWCVSTNKGHWENYKEDEKVNVIFININTGVKYIIAVRDNKVVEFADNTNDHYAEHPFDLNTAINFNKKSIDKANDILFEDIRNEILFFEYVEEGYVEGVKKMMEKGVDPSIDNNIAIRYASYNGYLEVVKLVLQDDRVDPSAENNYAILYASENGHLEVVKLLLKDSRVDPSAYDNYAIRNASYNGHLEVVKLLFQDKRVKNSLSKEDIKKYEKQIGLKEFKSYREFKKYKQSLEEYSIPEIKSQNVYKTDREKIEGIYELEYKYTQIKADNEINPKRKENILTIIENTANELLDEMAEDVKNGLFGYLKVHGAIDFEIWYDSMSDYMCDEDLLKYLLDENELSIYKYTDGVIKLMMENGEFDDYFEDDYDNNSIMYANIIKSYELDDEIIDNEEEAKEYLDKLNIECGENLKDYFIKNNLIDRLNLEDIANFEGYEKNIMENMYDDIFLILLNNFPGIENIIENAKDYYEKLDNFDNYTLTEKFVIFNEALHVAHYSGSMISDYINLNDVDADFLDEMSDRDVSDWNDELGELGIGNYKENNK